MLWHVLHVQQCLGKIRIQSKDDSSNSSLSMSLLLRNYFRRFMSIKVAQLTGLWKNNIVNAIEVPSTSFPALVNNDDFLCISNCLSFENLYKFQSLFTRCSNFAFVDILCFMFSVFLLIASCFDVHSIFDFLFLKLKTSFVLFV